MFCMVVQSLHLIFFYQMRKQGLQPNRGTFASILLAYGHAGTVDEGKSVFSCITEEYLIRPSLEHYSAMVYLLGRSGKLAEALKFIQNMPVEPNSSVWSALLTACRIHKNFEMAVLAGKRLLQLGLGNNTTRYLLSQAYSLCGKFEPEEEKDVDKPVGQCWIERNNTVHTFVVGDQSIPYSDKLYSWLKQVVVNVKRQTHVFDSESCIEEEEKENTSGVHSEKLAFAFALINFHNTNKTELLIKHLLCKFLNYTNRI